MSLDIEKNLKGVLDKVESKLGEKYKTANSIIKNELAEIKESASDFDAQVKALEEKKDAEIAERDQAIAKLKEENVDLLKSNNAWYEKHGALLAPADSKTQVIPTGDEKVSNEDFGKEWFAK